jgi:hypothetical protein
LIDILSRDKDLALRVEDFQKFFDKDSFEIEYKSFITTVMKPFIKDFDADQVILALKKEIPDIGEKIE